MWDVYGFRLCVVPLSLSQWNSNSLAWGVRLSMAWLFIPSPTLLLPSTPTLYLLLHTPDTWSFFDLLVVLQRHYYNTPGHFLMSPSLPKVLPVWWHFSHSPGSWILPPFFLWPSWDWRQILAGRPCVWRGRWRKVCEAPYSPRWWR